MKGDFCKLWVLVLAHTAWRVQGVVSTQKETVILSESPEFKVTWWVEDGENFVAQVQVKTQGWFGIGFNSKGQMNHADIVLGKVTSGSDYSLIDCHGVGNTFPVQDTKNDYTVREASREGETLKMEFTRKLDTCDGEDYPILEGGTTRMLWALPAGDASDSFVTGAHNTQQRGVQSVQLYGHPPHEVPDGETTFAADLLVKDVTIDAYPGGGHGVGTTYWCQTFEVNVTSKHHSVEIAPIVQTGNEGKVHHILLYSCPEIENHDEPNYSGLCYIGQNMPSYVNHCNGGTVVAGWAVGGATVKFPSLAGYPIGGSSPRHFLMEIHYDNPTTSVLVDNSGLKLMLTKQLRANDIGVLSTGHSVNMGMTIPPKRSHYTVQGWCAPECTNSALTQDVNIFGVFLHGHTAAVSLSARHIRNEVELEPIAVDNAYDFNYQALISVYPHKVLKKGDVLLTSCTYNTLDRETVTVGGLSTQEEMCLSYVYYYPKLPNFDNCKSSTKKNGKYSASCDAFDGEVQSIPSNYQVYKSPNTCGEASGECSDGTVDQTLGEQCDDGNLLNSDGCDGYCQPENSLVCIDTTEGKKCVKRTSVDKPKTFFAERCNKTFIQSVVMEMLPKLAGGIEKFFSEGGTFVACPLGAFTCNKANPNHDPICRDWLKRIVETLSCCQAGDSTFQDTSLQYLVKDHEIHRMGLLFAKTVCGDMVTDSTSCPFCGDGILNQDDDCDDGNAIDGDGCSSQCKVENKSVCKTAEQFSVCSIQGEDKVNPAVPNSAVRFVLNTLLILFLFRA